MTFIKFPSHRQRDNAERVVGKKAEYYSFFRSSGYGCWQVTAVDAAALKARGVRFARMAAPHDDLRKCWPMPPMP